MKGSVLSQPPKVKQRMETSGKKMHWSLVVFGKKYGITSNDCIHLYNLDKSMTTVLIRPVLQYFHRNRCIHLNDLFPVGKTPFGRFRRWRNWWRVMVKNSEALVFVGKLTELRSLRRACIGVFFQILIIGPAWTAKILHIRPTVQSVGLPVVTFSCFVLFCFARGQPGVKFERWKGGAAKHKSVT